MMNGKLLVLLSGKQALPGYSKNLCVQGQRSPTKQTFYSSSPVSHPMCYTASPFPREDFSPLKFSLPVTNPQPLLRAIQREGSLPHYAGTPSPQQDASLTKKKKPDVTVSPSPPRQSRLRGCGRIFYRYLKLQGKIPHMPAQLSSAFVHMHHPLPGPAGSSATATALPSGGLRIRRTSPVTAVASVHKPRFKALLNTIVLLTFLCSCFTDLRSAAGAYGNLPLKAVRLSVDINDVLIPDPSLMPFLSGLCHQCKDELFLLHLCNLPAFLYHNQRQGFLPEEDIQTDYVSHPKSWWNLALKIKSGLPRWCFSRVEQPTVNSKRSLWQALLLPRTRVY